MVSEKVAKRSGIVGARRGTVTLSLAAENVKTEWQKWENIEFVVKCDAGCVSRALATWNATTNAEVGCNRYVDLPVDCVGLQNKTEPVVILIPNASALPHCSDSNLPTSYLWMTV
jgi:hypothetical protein